MVNSHNCPGLVSVCMCVAVYVDVCILCMHACPYACMYILTYVCMHVNTYSKHYIIISLVSIEDLNLRSDLTLQKSGDFIGQNLTRFKAYKLKRFTPRNLQDFNVTVPITLSTFLCCSSRSAAISS